MGRSVGRAARTAQATFYAPVADIIRRRNAFIKNWEECINRHLKPENAIRKGGRGWKRDGRYTG